MNQWALNEYYCGIDQFTVGFGCLLTINKYRIKQSFPCNWLITNNSVALTQQIVVRKDKGFRLFLSFLFIAPLTGFPYMDHLSPRSQISSITAFMSTVLL